jgi:hypothetical protein
MRVGELGPGPAQGPGQASALQGPVEALPCSEAPKRGRALTSISGLPGASEWLSFNRPPGAPDVAGFAPATCPSWRLSALAFVPLALSGPF